jgi:membrane-bound metal-dependent hydrolase YbcI (DUF457 family)
MDTITHGIAGALISKATFRGTDLFPPFHVDKRRIVTWSLVLGAIFPDSDVLREILSSNGMLMITWHRSITHSLVLLPLWTWLFASATFFIARARKWNAPSFLLLYLCWFVGILSHIFLDLVTTYGTMIWSPIEWSRPAWDILFIVDFTFTAILLIPQLMAWAFEDPDRSRRRATIMWLIFTPAPFFIAKIAEKVGAPISNTSILVATILLAVLFLVPALLGWGHRVEYTHWNRAGLALAVLYLLACSFAHFTALQRVRQFAAVENIQVQSLGALPLPPSLWQWDGLVRAPRGVYEIHIDLSQGIFSSGSLDAIQRTYYPDAPANTYIDTALALPEVQTFFWFARFPVTRYHPEGLEAVVEFSDLRFPRIRPNRPASFTYQVRLSHEGKVLSQGFLGR